MFETLTNRLNQIFDGLRRRGKLSEADVDAAMREVRLALLEADVHFAVVKNFIAKIRERAIGAEVSKALNPGQQIIKIVNTAGRSQMDMELMGEFKSISANVNPVDTLLVVDSMIGQEALNIAQGFREAIDITGLILTKMDGDSRGGAAISIRSVTGVPIKFIGTGEKLDALETYDPARLSSRILGMGDMIGLIEKAEAMYDAGATEKQAEQAQKMMKGQFSLEDWLDQMKQMKKMGPLAQIMDMLPGQIGQAARQVDPTVVEKSFKQSEAIINSMTVKERRDPELLNASRRRRIASGSGVEVQDVNRLIKQFREAQNMMKMFQKTGGKGLPKMFG